MNNNDLNILNLYDHNLSSYEKIKTAFEKGKNVVGIVHATGTGKSYNALKLAYDNQNKKIMYIVPSVGIIEYIKKIISDNPNVELTRDFSNLEFRTYQSFINMSKEEIELLDLDLLILDEFHHLGAPIWGARINTIIETHPNLQIFGLTAYTVRDRGTSYERDMADPDTNELFSNNIISRYDLCDAMIDGVLPKPIYRSAYTNLIGLEKALEERVLKKTATQKEQQEYIKILNDIKKRIHDSSSIYDVIRKNINSNGKYIYFCPPFSEEGINDVETIKKEALSWFLNMGLKEEDIIFYSTTSEMATEGKKNRDAFYEDKTLDGHDAHHKLRVMFAINQYNEGIHAPNIDGVIMGRGTSSDIVYFEQLGRALAVKGNINSRLTELEKYSYDKLVEICKNKELPIKENATKEQLIELLLSPIVIDLANNFEFIKELENNLRNKLREITESASRTKRKIKISDASFNIEIENQDIFSALIKIRENLTRTWDDYYELALNYYEKNGNIDVPQRYRTLNGFEEYEYGARLGMWIGIQRTNYNNLSEERKQLLSKLGFTLDVRNKNWLEMYKLAKNYFNHYGHSNIPLKFKTKDGIKEDEDGYHLGAWLSKQRLYYNNLSSERKQLLSLIKVELNIREKTWMMMYALSNNYYKEYGHSNIPFGFKTKDGITEDKDGLALGTWISWQRKNYDKLTEERKQLLEEIGFELKPLENQWQKMYELACAYYKQYKHLNIPRTFKTKDGITEDKDGVGLGIWIRNQRKNYDKLSNEKKQLLKEIGFELKPLENQWQKMYNLALNYFNHYGHSNIPIKFKTKNGIDEVAEGLALGVWINTQRQYYDELSEERKQLLKEIKLEIIVREKQWQKMYELAKNYYEYYGHLNIPQKFKTKNGYEEDSEGLALGVWLMTQRNNKTKLSEERKELLNKIGIIWNIKKNKEEIKNCCLLYNIDYKLNENILKNISLTELESKILYLIDNKIPYLNNEGLLHEIFSMSNLNLEVKYGINLEKMITNYSKYIKKGKSV